MGHSGKSGKVGKLDRLLQTGPAWPGRARDEDYLGRSVAQAAKTAKAGKVEKWIGSYRHKAGPGWGRPGWPGQAAGVRQGRAGPGQARPLGCCPGGWKEEQLEK